jgi:hypothetical protein
MDEARVNGCAGPLSVTVVVRPSGSVTLTLSTCVPGFGAGIGHAPGLHGVQTAASTRQLTDRLPIGSSASATVIVAVVVEVRVNAGALSVAVGAKSVWTLMVAEVAVPPRALVAVT